MKKSIAIVALMSTVILTSCGGEEKEEKKTDFCECTKPGEVPEGCDYVQKMDQEEYFKKVKECDHYQPANQ
ncbi:MAG: hypothetical protein KDC84_06315 [Crocinitomicaceae bacterium]|nr:hypothetical protein [Crocinitomicaceae bacterium]